MGENDRSECVGSFALHQVGTKSHPRWMYHSGALTEKRGNKILNGGGGGLRVLLLSIISRSIFTGLFCLVCWKRKLERSSSFPGDETSSGIS